MITKEKLNRFFIFVAVFNFLQILFQKPDHRFIPFIHNDCIDGLKVSCIERMRGSMHPCIDYLPEPVQYRTGILNRNSGPNFINAKLNGISIIYHCRRPGVDMIIICNNKADIKGLLFNWNNLKTGSTTFLAKRNRYKQRYKYLYANNPVQIQTYFPNLSCASRTTLSVCPVPTRVIPISLTRIKASSVLIPPAAFTCTSGAECLRIS